MATGGEGSGSRCGSSSSTATSRFCSSEALDDHCPLWSYVTVYQSRDLNIGGGNRKWKCNFCNKDFNGSYSRVKGHLLRQSGKGIQICASVTEEYLRELLRIVSEAEERCRPKNVPLPNRSIATLMGPASTSEGKKRRVGGTSALEKAFKNDARDRLTSEIARMFYSGGLPFNFARNPYYLSSYTFSANNQIAGYVPPGYNALRTTLLQKERANIERLLQPIKNTWHEKGMSLVSDGWSDAQRRPLINFMAASEGGPIFLKAVDGSKEYKDKHYIAKLMIDTIREVGSENVVQVVTDNAPVCKAAGLLVEGNYPHIFWTPCVVHTLNLALKNICAAKNTKRNENVYVECHWITQVSDDACFIRNFIMNHSMRLNIFNSFVSLKLLAVAETRFASTIVMLKRLKLIKRGLQNMVISEEWGAYREDDVGKAKALKEMVLNDVWWDKVDYIISFTRPIYEMLRLCDTDKPTLHLVYNMWDSMIEQVKAAIYGHELKELDEQSTFYDVVYDVLIDRWTKSCTPLHCMAHSLNPRYYSNEWLAQAPNRVAPHRDAEISDERNKYLRRYFHDVNERKAVMTEYARFSGAADVDVFDTFDCLQDRWDLDPKTWWVTYGASMPRLQDLALKLLVQPCSSSCCERNWSTYSFVHSMKRSKIHPKRAEDLVFIHTNLRLLSRKNNDYIKGPNRMWDIGGDQWDPFDGAGVLEVASLSLDEPDMEAVLFTDAGEGHEEIETFSQIL